MLTLATKRDNRLMSKVLELKKFKLKNFFLTWLDHMFEEPSFKHRIKEP